ncbi:Flagellar hook-associated protein 1 [Thalassoglobus neptunius]|uniref:Flagellar hook-associated protein 1 n=1 Tax=Thalassoglobus neptunius TaxID=1938619 RepID=A0A5C5VYI2_9PLAN|nr:flagellar hook-associated protein FlgK [Thalassoglobus neptunius]TWT43013.1 Flagellar hook-associated protein 1 [Thalassoglobus neptunius]
MIHYDIGLSALQANQQALSTIANNIANANTTGFHRQRVEFVDRFSPGPNGTQVGTGVVVTGIERLRDHVSEVALTQNTSLQAESETVLESLRKIETVLLPTEGSLVSSVTEFFNQLEELAAHPTVATVRDAVVESARHVIQQTEQLHSRLNDLSRSNAVVIEQEVAEVNRLAEDLSALNRRIRILENQGTVPNALRDQRERLINDLANYVDVSSSSLLNNDLSILVAGGGVVIGVSSSKLEVTANSLGPAEFTSTTAGSLVTIESGSIAGRAQGQVAIDDIRQALHDWTNTFVATIDHVQATGLGEGIGFQELIGERSVSDPNAILSSLSSPFPVQEGTLYVNLTEVVSGETSIHRIDVDPETESLQDIVNKIDAVSGLNATYQSQSKAVSLNAADGYTISFSGGIDFDSGTGFATGTSQPELFGIPTGENARYTVRAVGTGTVGQTSPLKLEVSETASGEVIKTLDVGAGTVVGQTIEVVDGVSLRLSSGDLVDGESFEFGLIGQPDETGLLTTLGIGTFFSGDSETGLKLNSLVEQNSRNVAVSKTGAASDTSNAQFFLEARDLKRFGNGRDNFEERLESLAIATAFRIEGEQTGQEFLSEQQSHLATQRDSISGVDPNEELLLMLEYQRAFQAASRFVSVIDETLDELLQLV